MVAMALPIEVLYRGETANPTIPHSPTHRETGDIGYFSLPILCVTELDFRLRGLHSSETPA